MSTVAASRRILVVGSGAIGLRTAVELLRRNSGSSNNNTNTHGNVSVILKSPVHPLHPSVCSQGAGGLWMPFHCDDPRVDRWAMETLDELHPMAKDETNSVVEWVPCVALHQDHAGPSVEDFLATNYHKGTGGKSQLPAWTKDERLQFQHMTTEMLEWQNQVLGLAIPTLDTLVHHGYRHAWVFHSPIVDAPNMLIQLLEQVTNHPNTIDVQVETGVWYQSIDEMIQDAISLDCDTVVNCTGMGAKQLLHDDQLIGARGILLHFDRASVAATADVASSAFQQPRRRDAAIFAEDGPWGSNTEPAYLIPRGKHLVVGGSYLEGDDRDTITTEERQRLLQNAKRFGINVDETPPIGEWTGFRPSRPTTKCEVDQTITTTTTGNTKHGGITLIHSYGHGGSGWTINVGVAKETAKLLNL